MEDNASGSDQSSIMRIALAYWVARDNEVAPTSHTGKCPEYLATQRTELAIIDQIYREELMIGSSHARGEINTNLPKRALAEKLKLLDSSGYLENFLWPAVPCGEAGSTESITGSLSYEHMLSIMLMVNEKVRAGVSAWAFVLPSRRQTVLAQRSRFTYFFQRVASQCVDTYAWDQLNSEERAIYVSFLAQLYGEGCFERGESVYISEDTTVSTSLNVKEKNRRQSFDTDLVNGCVISAADIISGPAMRLLSLPIWEALTANRLAQEFDNFPQLLRHWQHQKAKKNIKGLGLRTDISNKSHAFSNVNIQHDPMIGKRTREGDDHCTSDSACFAKRAKGAPLYSFSILDENFFPLLLKRFLTAIAALPPSLSTFENAAISKQRGTENYVMQLIFVEKVLELLVDLLSQLHTRRFLRTLIDDMHLLEVCFIASYARAEMSEFALFRKLLARLKFYIGFEIQDQTGEALSDAQISARHFRRVQT